MGKATPQRDVDNAPAASQAGGASDRLIRESLDSSRHAYHGKNLVSTNEAADKIAKGIMQDYTSNPSNLGTALDRLDQFAKNGWSQTAEKVRGRLDKELQDKGFPAGSHILADGQGQVKLRTKDGGTEIRDPKGAEVSESSTRPEKVPTIKGNPATEKITENRINPTTGQPYQEDTIRSRPDGKHETFAKTFSDPKKPDDLAAVGQWKYKGPDGEDRTIDGVKAVQKTWDGKAHEYNYRVMTENGEFNYRTNEQGKTTKVDQTDFKPDGKGLASRNSVGSSGNSLENRANQGDPQFVKDGDGKVTGITTNMTGTLNDGNMVTKGTSVTKDAITLDPKTGNLLERDTNYKNESYALNSWNTQGKQMDGLKGADGKPVSMDVTHENTKFDPKTGLYTRSYDGADGRTLTQTLSNDGKTVLKANETYKEGHEKEVTGLDGKPTKAVSSEATLDPKTGGYNVVHTLKDGTKINETVNAKGDSVSSQGVNPKGQYDPVQIMGTDGQMHSHYVDRTRTVQSTEPGISQVKQYHTLEGSWISQSVNDKGNVVKSQEIYDKSQYPKGQQMEFDGPNGKFKANVTGETTYFDDKGKPVSTTYAKADGGQITVPAKDGAPIRQQGPREVAQDEQFVRDRVAHQRRLMDVMKQNPYDRKKETYDVYMQRIDGEMYKLEHPSK